MAGADEHVKSLDRRQWRECERLVARFEEARRRGEAPAMEEYLPAAGPLRQAVLVELVHTDLELRLEAGEPVRVEAYLARFPELAADADAVVDLAAAEYALRRRREPHLTEEEYQRRFPHLGAALVARLGAPLQETVTAPAAKRLDFNPLAAKGERAEATVDAATLPAPSPPAVVARDDSNAETRALLRWRLLVVFSIGAGLGWATTL